MLYYLLIFKNRKRKSHSEEEENHPHKRRKHRGTEKTTATDALLVFPRNRTVEVKCSKCSLTSLDIAPAFWKTDLRFYVLRYKSNCKGCGQKGERVFNLPTEDIPWMTSELYILKKDRYQVIEVYNNWATTADYEGDKTRLYKEVEEWEIEEAKIEFRERAWKDLRDNEYFYDNERLNMDMDLDERSAKEKMGRKQNLGEFLFWGPVNNRIVTAEEAEQYCL
jgi:hypothetical protein